MSKDDEFVKQHIELIQRLLLEKTGIKLPETVVKDLEDKYLNNDQMSLIDKIKGINKDIENYLANVINSNEMLPNLDIKGKKEEKRVELNHHDVNLMLIAKATTPIELQDAINKIPNFTVNLTSGEMSSDDFNFIKSSVFDMYKDSIPKDERYGKDFDMTIDEYKNLDSNIHDNYDTVHMDDGSLKGKDYSTDNHVDLEDVKNDRMFDREESVTLVDEDEVKNKDLLENFEGTAEEKARFDVRKKDMDDMLQGSDNIRDNANAITSTDNKPKKLQLFNPSNQNDSGFVQTQSMYIMILVTLLVLFALLIKFLI